VVVHGLGGSGKSRLLGHFRNMALGKIPGSPVPVGRGGVVWLDWEDEQRDDPASYAGVAGPAHSGLSAVSHAEHATRAIHNLGNLKLGLGYIEEARQLAPGPGRLLRACRG
jgi:hypothetical protein